jgi:hypothetical protein
MRGWLPLAVAAAALVARLGLACGADTPCSDLCTDAESATFHLSCNPNDLVSVVATGPCSNPDASLEWYTGAETEWDVAVTAQSPGECHIVLTFATGFTYSTDVTFTSQNQGCGCPSFLGPVPGTGAITVNNPADTCVALPRDAGPGD